MTQTTRQQGAPTADVAEPAIVARGVARDYGERPVLRDVALELPADATLAVLGANGAGKTTFLRMLATLLRPSAGELGVLGAELPRQAWKARGRIGYLGHQPLLYRELSVRENLEFHARLHRLDRPAGRIDELLERSGLGRRGDELVRNLSAGMAQRAAICRALLHEPELLLLDEPTAHLDAAAAPLVDELLGARPGRARVIVTHDVEAGLAQADLVLVLGGRGRVEYCGSPTQISAAEVRRSLTGEIR